MADLVNKFQRLLPPTTDTYDTCDYLNQLKLQWPRLRVKVETSGASECRVVTALHIFFPWAKEVMGVLAPCLFVDATFNVTVFNFKVVAFTTLDGNRQHRPLQLDFIMQTQASCWQACFDFFDDCMSEGNEGGTFKPDIHIVVDTSQKKTYELDEGATERIYTAITDQVQTPFFMRSYDSRELIW